jgi:hypothetical protein
VVVFLHGGGWQSGDRSLYHFVGAALAARGFVTVIPDYPVWPEVRFLAFLQDAGQYRGFRRQSGTAVRPRCSLLNHGGRDRMHRAVGAPVSAI